MSQRFSVCVLWSVCIVSCSSTTQPTPHSPPTKETAQVPEVQPCRLGFGEDPSIHRVVEPSGPWVDGEKVIIAGHFQRGRVWCTELWCDDEDDPCCNSCGGSGRLREFAPMEFQGLGTCGGDNCNVSCSIEEDTHLKVWGVVQGVADQRVFHVRGTCVLQEPPDLPSP